MYSKILKIPIRNYIFLLNFKRNILYREHPVLHRKVLLLEIIPGVEDKRLKKILDGRTSKYVPEMPNVEFCGLWSEESKCYTSWRR